ncbi:NADPH-dependent FMN reductase [Reinekea sp.]|jgi:chromate reductase|uniref:NADPH-dependent FMN reductase n=1 Tax=Reinekea sp. TaxID=1970455 RepID=UPI0039895CDC
MNILGIVGSLRKDSVHKQVFNHYKEIAKNQFELSEGSIVDIPMYDGENMDNAAVVKLAEQIRKADGVIFFSPEYNYSIPGSLKNALDYLSRVDPQPFVGKPAAIIGASPGAVGSARMQYHLRQVGVFLDIDFMNKPEVMISGVFSKLADGRITDATTVEFLEVHSKAFEAFVKKHN